MSADRCGTYAGYQAHRYRGEPPCERCRRAQADYTAGWRGRNRDGYARHLASAAARQRAHTRLAARHRAEFRELLDQERRRGETGTPAADRDSR